MPASVTEISGIKTNTLSQKDMQFSFYTFFFLVFSVKDFDILKPRSQNSTYNIVVVSV